MKIFEKPLLHFGDTYITLQSIIVFVIVFLITVFFIMMTKKALLKKIFPRHNIKEGVAKAYSSILTYLILIIGIMIGLGIAGIPVTGLFAGGAALLIGIGFGIQNIVNNWISGIIILFERPIKEGDFIEVEGIYGTVTAIAARSTRVTTPSGVTIIVPNSKILEQNVINRSYVDTTLIDIPVLVTYDTDIEKARAVLLRIAVTHPLILREPEPAVTVSELADSGVKIKLLVWIKEQEKFIGIRNYVNYEILKEFKKEGIEIAYPQMEVKIKNA